MPNPIRVAVTGLGVSRPMLKYYRESSDTKLVLLHDVDEKRAKEVAAENPGVRYTTKFEDVFSSAEVDMVDVSTPNHIHPEQTIAVLKAGKHVLCQKPMAPTVRDCHRMCEAAKSSGKTLGMLMVQLSQPLTYTLRTMVQNGLLGRIAGVRQRNAHRILYRMKSKDHWRAKASNIGGGSFMQLGVHYLNLLQFILDDEVVRVSGFAKNLYTQHSIEGEDVVAAAGEFKKGPLIALESGYSSVGNAYGIYGTDGHITRANNKLTLELNAPYKDELLEYPTVGRKVGETIEYDVGTMEDASSNYPHIQQLVFARAIRDGKPAPQPGEVGLRDVAIIQAIYRAAETGRRVEVRELLDEK
jgi:predicted dehydrogenase